MINSFRVTDLHSLITAFGRNHIGRKNELQIRAVDILIKPPLDINIEKYKQKIRELYKNCRLVFIYIKLMIFSYSRLVNSIIFIY